jgi:nitrilase
MTRFETVRVAAVQATPVVLDAERSVGKAIELSGPAAGDGAKLVVLPEAFVSLYPANACAAAPASGFGGLEQLWERTWESSIDVSGPAVDLLAAACAEHNVICAIGVNERESERPGTLYNTLLLISGEGLLHRRDAVYQGGPQIWIAPTADDSDGWLASMRHIAIESGAFVVSAPQFIPATAFGDDFPLPLPPGKEVFGRGGAAIIDPEWGTLIAGPLYDEVGIVLAACDLRRGLQAKRWFDAVGHYSRTEVLTGPEAAAPRMVDTPSDSVPR